MVAKSHKRPLCTYVSEAEPCEIRSRITAQTSVRFEKVVASNINRVREQQQLASPVRKPIDRMGALETPVWDVGSSDGSDDTVVGINLEARSNC